MNELPLSPASFRDKVSKIVIPACPESFFVLLVEYATAPEGFPTSGNDRRKNSTLCRALRSSFD